MAAARRRAPRDPETAAQLARVDERLNSIERLLSAVAAEQRAASEGRRRIYEAQEASRTDMVKIGMRLDTVERGVDAIRPTTAELERVRDRVMFAGRLGQALWRIGEALLSAAAGAAAAWYAMTGKPPP